MMKKVFSLVGVLLASILCLTACGTKEDDSSKYNINVNVDENIGVKAYVDYANDYLIVHLTNNNSYNIGSFDVEATFYDNSGNQIGDAVDSGLGFIKGGNYIVVLDLPEDDDYKGYVPDKINLSVKIDQEYQSIVGEETLYNGKVTTSYKEVEDEIEINLTNNSEVELSTVKVAVLFMKNGKPIYADSLNKRLDAGKSDSETIDIPEDWEASENSDEDVLIDYDSIEIIVNRATVN